MELKPSEKYGEKYHHFFGLNNCEHYCAGFKWRSLLLVDFSIYNMRYTGCNQAMLPSGVYLSLYEYLRWIINRLFQSCISVIEVIPDIAINHY